MEKLSWLFVGGRAAATAMQEARDMLSVEGAARNPSLDRFGRDSALVIVKKVAHRAAGDLIGKPVAHKVLLHVVGHLRPTLLSDARSCLPADPLGDHGRVLTGQCVAPQLPADRGARAPVARATSSFSDLASCI